MKLCHWGMRAKVCLAATGKRLTPAGKCLAAAGKCLAAMGICLTPAGAQAEQVTVTLVGGSRITASLLRENDQGVVLDLGHDVVQVPRERLLDIQRESLAAGNPNEQDRGIFRTGRLEPADVPELVRRFGDSVVLVKNPAGLGSGFVISDKGHIITNYHVVEGQTKVQVTMFRQTDQGYEKQELKRVRILALNPLRDIALIQLDASELTGAMPTPVVINDQDDLRVGDLNFAIGNPLGLERSVTQGIVSSTSRTMGHLRLIQTDASINPGNSGGPMFNARGEIVGIVCAGATSFDGLAFGIPAKDLVDFLLHRDSYLFDANQPQNGVNYLDPPFRDPAAKAAADPVSNPPPTAPATPPAAPATTLEKSS